MLQGIWTINIGEPIFSRPNELHVCVQHSFPFLHLLRKMLSSDAWCSYRAVLSFFERGAPRNSTPAPTCLAPPQSFIIAGWRVLLSQKLSKYLGYISEIIWAFKSQECVCFSPLHYIFNGNHVNATRWLKKIRSSLIIMGKAIKRSFPSHLVGMSYNPMILIDD